MLRFLVILAALVIAAPAHADPADIAAASRSVVRVVLVGQVDNGIVPLGHGSGVAVAPDLILTNAHVVRPMQEDDTVRVGVVPSQGRGGAFAQVVAVSPANDLALLRLTGGRLPVAALFSGGVEDGSDVHAIGYPANVDVAQGLDIADIMAPVTPVKTRGQVSAGRSSKAFDTILHTAAIGSGNSGGPLVDGCGRVVGINSFGTLASDGDSEFYFAVSMREVASFLRSAGVRARTTAAPCRSFAELDRAEAARQAGDQARSAEQQRANAAKSSAASELALRDAQFSVQAERENRMALAFLALLLALGCAGYAGLPRDGDEATRTRIAIGGGLLLVLLAAIAWLTRPPFSAIEDRAAQASGETAAGPAKPAAGLAGPLVCVIDPARSRITVSATADVPLNWTASGCVNGASQYGAQADKWLRVMVPANEDTVTASRFDPATATYASERWLLGMEAMTKLRAARREIDTPGCSADAEAARRFGEAQAALIAELPATPNERLIYNCSMAAAPAQ